MPYRRRSLDAGAPVFPRLPTYFVSHGGASWPFLKAQVGAAYDQLEQSLVDIKRRIGVRPNVVLVIASRWEGPEFMVSSGAAPGMI